MVEPPHCCRLVKTRKLDDERIVFANISIDDRKAGMGDEVCVSVCVYLDVASLQGGTPTTFAYQHKECEFVWI